MDQKIVSKGEAATKGKKRKNAPERVWINPSSEVGGFRAEREEAVDLQQLFLPSDDYLMPIIASNTKNCSFPLLPPLVSLQCILGTSGPLPRIEHRTSGGHTV